MIENAGVVVIMTVHYEICMQCRELSLKLDVGYLESGNCCICRGTSIKKQITGLEHKGIA